MVSRRSLLQTAVASPLLTLRRAHAAAIPLFDGKTLDGWIQSENSATSLSSANITDPAAFLAKLATATDPITTSIRARLQPDTRASIGAFDANNPDAKAVIAAVVKNLNAIISGPGLENNPRSSDRNATGLELARLNKLTL